MLILKSTHNEVVRLLLAQVDSLRARVDQLGEHLEGCKARADRLEKVEVDLRAKVRKREKDIEAARAARDGAMLQLGHERAANAVGRGRREEIGKQLDELRDLANDVMNFFVANASEGSEAADLAVKLADKLNT